MLTKKIVKNFTKKIICAFSVALLLFVTIAPTILKSSVVYADNVNEKIQSYINSMVGAIYKGVDTITSIPENIGTALTSHIADGLQGGGIYQDAQGNYHFTNSFMNQYYQILSSNGSNDVYVCSDFSNFDNCINSQYTNGDYANAVIEILAQAKSYGSSSDNLGYFASCGQYIRDNRYYCTDFFVYIIPSDYAYICCRDYTSYAGMAFYKSNGNIISSGMKTIGCHCQYDSQGDSFLGLTRYDYNGTNTHPASTYQPIIGYKGGTSYLDLKMSTVNNVYDGFPKYSNMIMDSGLEPMQVSYFCSDAVIVSKTANSGSTYINQTTNYVDFFKVDYNDLTINQTVLNNNNWNNIYYNYVTNVRNEYKQGSGLTKKDVQKIMKKYNDALILAIKSGVEDLEEQFASVIKWLDKISIQIDDINEYLSQILKSLDKTKEVIVNTEKEYDYLYTSNTLFAAVDSNNKDWNLTYNASGTYSYYVFDITDIDSFKLTTVNTNRTRILLSNYEPATFDSDLKSNSNKTISGNYAAVLENTVNDYEVLNSDNSKYLYVYCGSQQVNESVSISYDSVHVVPDNGDGGSCNWTDEDITRLMQILERYYLYSGDYLTQLQSINTNTDGIEGKLDLVKNAIENLQSYLSTWKTSIDYIPNITQSVASTDSKVSTLITSLATITTALNVISGKIDNIGGGGGVDVTIPTIDPDIIDDITDMATDKVDDIVDSLDVIGTVLEAAVPFCFIAAIGGFITALSADPVAPEWSIPFENEDGTISENVDIDLDWIDGIHDLWIALVTILFVVGLMAVSFMIFSTFGVLVN